MELTEIAMQFNCYEEQMTLINCDLCDHKRSINVRNFSALSSNNTITVVHCSH